MQSFVFAAPKILKSAVFREDDRVVQYTISTSRAGPITFARQRTTVQRGEVSAAIDWRERAFEIEGHSHGVDILKRKTSNFSETRFWKWGKGTGDEYKVRYSNTDSTWTATTSTGETVAELTSSLGRARMPTMRMAADFRDEAERWFLLLVLLYSETKRLDRDA